MTSEVFIETLASHYKKELPFVVYSKPNDLKVIAILQKTKNLYLTEDYIESGFVFAPFDSDKKTVIIPIAHSVKIETKNITIEESIVSKSNEKENSNQFQQEKEYHIKLVKKAISKIEEGIFKKVVISRIEKKKISETNAITLFLKLLKIYNAAFTYCFYHPKIGLWLGATPETFLQIEGKRFKTMSLAGTRTVDDNSSWKAKELEEQQLVTKFILDGINNLVDNIKTSNVETVQAGRLLHLRTNISGILNFKELNLRQLLNKLHPTPAVCGLPKEKAKSFILENEDYDRTYYTGFLGELNFKKSKSRNSNRRNVENNAYSSINNTSSLYVNLRCMQIKGREGYLYIGGGITKESIAEKEWEETVNKSYTIKKVLL